MGMFRSCVAASVVGGVLLSFGCQSTATYKSKMPITGRQQVLPADNKTYTTIDTRSDLEYKMFKAFRTTKPSLPARQKFLASGGKEVAADEVKSPLGMEEMDLDGFKAKYPALAAIVDRIFSQAQQAYAARQIPENIKSNYDFLVDLRKVKFLVFQNDLDSPSGTNVPFGKIVLKINPTKLANKTYQEYFAFALSHEIGHVIAMHTEEDQLNMGDEVATTIDSTFDNMDGGIGKGISAMGLAPADKQDASKNAPNVDNGSKSQHQEFNEYLRKEYSILKQTAGAGNAKAYNEALAKMQEEVRTDGRAFKSAKAKEHMNNKTYKKANSSGDTSKDLHEVTQGLKGLTTSLVNLPNQVTSTFDGSMAVPYFHRQEFEADRIGYALYLKTSLDPDSPILLFAAKSTDDEPFTNGHPLSIARAILLMPPMPAKPTN